MKRTDYLDWDTTFIAMGHLIAKRSKDPKTQVGAVIVSPENIIVGMGYNGFPRGISDDEWSWNSPEKHAAVIHAEVNAVLNSNQQSLKECRLYVPFFTCSDCARLVIQAGITEVIYCSDKHYHSDKYRMKEARRMYDMAGVSFRQFTPESEIRLTFEQNTTDGGLLPISDESLSINSEGTQKGIFEMANIPKSVPATNQRGIPSTVIYQKLGILQPTLTYWIRTGLISPSIRIGKRGRLSRNEWGTTLFSYNDFLELKIIVSLRNKGLSVRRIRKVLEELRKRNYSLDDLDYITDGKGFFIRLPDTRDGIVEIGNRGYSCREITHR